MLDPRRQVREMLLKGGISLLSIMLGPVLEPESNWNVLSASLSNPSPNSSLLQGWPLTLASAPLGSLLGMQNLRLHPIFAEAEC